MPTLQPYNRQAAVAYAHRWAFGRNPAYSNFDGMGGDCTNFASQCLYAGTGIMNFTPTYGWYYLSLKGGILLSLFDERGGQPRPGGGGDVAFQLSPRRLRPTQLRGRGLRTYAYYCGNGESADVE